ncbi:MAG: DUF1801 domain-containing protein [Bradyrhizobium sp.]|nr:MAG: DUF1801 domain-containing protein [Bradyrhizobium sp.]
MPVDVADAFAAFPAESRSRLLHIRGLILATAAASEGVGLLTETVKWGEPAYLTEATGSGATIRLGCLRPDYACAVLFNCRTTLVETFREQFPGTFRFQKNRAIVLDPSAPLPEIPLTVCLRMALTYHQKRRAFRR